MEISFFTEKRCYREAGVCIATLSLRLPSTGTRLDRFYKRLAERYILAYERHTVSAARQEFSKSDDEKKRFRFKPFVFTLDFEARKTSDTVLVTTCERLMRQGRVIAERELSERFSSSELLLLPQKKQNRKKHL